MSRNEYVIVLSFVPVGASGVIVSALNVATTLSSPSNGIVIEDLLCWNDTTFDEFVNACQA